MPGLKVIVGTDGLHGSSCGKGIHLSRDMRLVLWLRTRDKKRTLIMRWLLIDRTLL